MRRAALQGCALLLRRGGRAAGAASEPPALAAAGLQAVLGGQHAGRQLCGPWLQALLHGTVPSWRQANSDGSSDPETTEWVARATGTGRGKLLPVRTNLAADLQPLAALAGVADATGLASSVAALGPGPERRVIEHGPAVAERLLSLGVPRPQLAQLLLRCPYLFSWPAEQRAAVLFRQLARLGLTAGEAARCFEKQPTAAGVVSFEPAIAVLADLFAVGSKAGSGKSGEQLLGDLLRNQPAAIGLLELQPSTLQQRISTLVQRYGPHWKQPNKQAVIVSALQQQWALLRVSPQRLLALEAVLQQEVGQQPGDGARLLATVVQRHARAVSCNPETLRQRVQALLAEFGLEHLLQAGPGSLAGLLHVDAATWQRALAVWQLLGVADPAALGLRNTHSLTLDWLAPDRLASLVALQQLLPWQPSPADAVQQFASYVATAAPPRLMGRLLFLQQEGVLPLLVADKRAAVQRRRQQCGLPANQTAPEQPQLVSARDVGKATDAEFCNLLAQLGSQQQQQQQQQRRRQDSDGQNSSSSGTSVSTVAERYKAFMARLPQLPAYQQLLAEGVAESRRLVALLPPELAFAAAGDKRA